MLCLFSPTLRCPTGKMRKGNTVYCAVMYAVRGNNSFCKSRAMIVAVKEPGRALANLALHARANSLPKLPPAFIGATDHESGAILTSAFNTARDCSPTTKNDLTRVSVVSALRVAPPLPLR